jgi:hypothetical protein
VHFGGYFAAPPLRLGHPRKRNKLVVWTKQAYSRISNS